ncbi:hypothetical protein Q9R08_18460 [Microbacterium sp. QXD-8]|uniref:Transporter n=1 Tax=Microbacterium psychrotolerans TaxID=3068321 RepID=A0ABU0Z7J2_9MICO|nr:hypothetical protein [Microbacterium sp. QXD-8]MDQ7879978.1 hypothetical protein [Microbacterium sp. QXD-8]
MNTPGIPDLPDPADDDAPRDAAAMLDLVRSQQDRVTRRLAAEVPLILLAWGIAWFVGFGLLWLIDGAKPAAGVPLPVAVTVFIVLMAGALVATAILGIRSGRGIRASAGAAFTGAVYGWSWTIAFIAMFVFGTALVRNGMPPELANIYYPTASTLLVGLLYFVGGGIWHAKPLLWLGGWIMVVALVASFFGYPTHYLVFSIAGGGVFLVGALVAWLWIRR